MAIQQMDKINLSRLTTNDRAKESFKSAKNSYTNLDPAKKAEDRESYKYKKNMFITLIAESMKNPDPNSQIKPEETIMQMMQMHHIEQSALTVEKLGEVKNQLEHLTKFGQASVQGKDVKISSNLLLVQNGKAKFEYELPKDLQALKIIISNERGRPIKTIELDHPANGKNPALGQGTHLTEWDGKDMENNDVPLGPNEKYRVKFLAKGFDNKPVEIKAQMIGKIDDIDFTTKNSDVTIGHHQYPIDQLRIFQNNAQTNPPSKGDQQEQLSMVLSNLNKTIETLNTSSEASEPPSDEYLRSVYY